MIVPAELSSTYDIVEPGGELKTSRRVLGESPEFGTSIGPVLSVCEELFEAGSNLGPRGEVIWQGRVLENRLIVSAVSGQEFFVSVCPFFDDAPSRTCSSSELAECLERFMNSHRRSNLKVVRHIV